MVNRVNNYKNNGVFGKYFYIWWVGWIYIVWEVICMVKSLVFSMDLWGIFEGNFYCCSVVVDWDILFFVIEII